MALRLRVSVRRRRLDLMWIMIFLLISSRASHGNRQRPSTLNSGQRRGKVGSCSAMTGEVRCLAAGLHPFGDGGLGGRGEIETETEDSRVAHGRAPREEREAPRINRRVCSLVLYSVGTGRLNFQDVARRATNRSRAVAMPKFPAHGGPSALAPRLRSARGSRQARRIRLAVSRFRVYCIGTGLLWRRTPSLSTS